MKIQKVFKYDNAWIERKQTKYIIIHHALAKKCTIYDIQDWHIKNGSKSGTGYNFLVRKNGDIFEGRPINIEGAHTKGYNQISIGICFEGNFDIEEMEPIQYNSGIELIRYIQHRYTDTKIMKHNNFAHKTCPGMKFPFDEMIIDVKNNHWAEPIYNSLTASGLIIHEKRFDDKITRGECMALIKQLYDILK